MDELLPFVGTLPAIAGAGSLDPKAREDVSLETVASCENAGAGAHETGRRETDCDPDGDEPEKLLADIQNDGNADRDDKRVVGQAGITVAQGDVGVVPLSANNTGLTAHIDLRTNRSEPPDADPHVRWCGRGRAGVNHLGPPLCRLGRSTFLWTIYI